MQDPLRDRMFTSIEFDSIVMLKSSGFEGFETVSSLFEQRCAQTPSLGGVYIVIRTSRLRPSFLASSPAGWHKGKNPAFPVDELAMKWVWGASVVYIGVATGATERSTLKGRIWAYLRHGNGACAGHAGGRAIWQLPDSQALQIAWKSVADPQIAESQLIDKFEARYGNLPFANRRR